MSDVLAGERAPKRLETPLDRGARIAIEGRADGFRDRRQSDVFGVKGAVAIGEGAHSSGLFQHEIEEERLFRRHDRGDRRLGQRGRIRRVGIGGLGRRVGVGRRLQWPISAASRKTKREQDGERLQARGLTKRYEKWAATNDSGWSRALYRNGGRRRGGGLGPPRRQTVPPPDAQTGRHSGNGRPLRDLRPKSRRSSASVSRAVERAARLANPVQKGDRAARP